MANRVYTIGHSTRTFEEVLSMLQNHEITHLVDVRSFPASRTNPQWNQDAIVEHSPGRPLPVDPGTGRQAAHP